MGVRLVALDIDGTIVAPGAELPTERIRVAVRELTRQGIAVVLASGRMFPGTAKIARHLEVQTPLVCQQGCAVQRLDGTVLHEFPIRHEVALEVVEYARAIARPYEWFNTRRYIASAETEATQEYGRVSGITPEYHAEPEQSGVSPTGVGIISSAEEAAHIHRSLVARYADELHVLDFPTVTVAVAPEANKGHALSLLCADFGIERAEVVAIGDSVNDAAMLAWAGRGIALAHSDRYALDAADEVLEDGEEPVARLLEALAHWGR